MNSDCLAWSQEEFGNAELGDPRRVKRLVQMAGQAAERPAGRITEVFSEDAEREGAFRYVQNDHVSAAAMATAAWRACAARALGQPFVFVPVDQTSLGLPDPSRRRRVGGIGSYRIGAQGLEVMSAIAVDRAGVPLGICGQEYWSRGKARRKKVDNRQDGRKLQEKETQHWLTVMDQVSETFETFASGTKPWFQLDRGADAWPVILAGLESGAWFTVRAAQDRRVFSSEGVQKRLWDEIENATVLGKYDVEIPSGPGREARTAHMTVRASSVTLQLADRQLRKAVGAQLFAVLAREDSNREDALEWLLLTNVEVHSFEDAKKVIDGYVQRWRIEQFHRLWKSGQCNVEDTLLQDRDHIERWVVILASVAMRLFRLTYLARHDPTQPATAELSRREIDALIMLKRPPGYQRGDTPTIGEAVLWLARLGGYPRRPPSKPPGAIVIGRGLRRIQSIAEVLGCGERCDQH